MGERMSDYLEFKLWKMLAILVVIAIVSFIRGLNDR